jgi:EAL domain-containing protein (putative c-di-GMP-specific phosphodiesterase class I)
MAEVLVRLREEETALLPPGEFLPAFEHYGMMPQLDRWVRAHTREAPARRLAHPRVHDQRLRARRSRTPSSRASSRAAARIRVAPSAVAFEIDESDALARPRRRCASRPPVRARRGACCSTVSAGAGVVRRVKALRRDFVKVDGSITRKLAASEGRATRWKAMLRVGEALGFGVVGRVRRGAGILEQLQGARRRLRQGFGILPASGPGSPCRLGAARPSARGREILPTSGYFGSSPRNSTMCGTLYSARLCRQ